MPDLYPLLMLPEFDPRPWGTLDLSPVYPGRRFEQKIGEAWLTGDHCKVANGPLAGLTLNDLSQRYGRDLVGNAAPEATRFPLLVKFLFPHEKLSVQVHPDDDAARRDGLPWGKTECWYVLDAKPGAQVALGLKRGATRAELERAIQQKKAEDLLNWIDIHAGEMIYVAGGTVHTLGPGSILVETQQQSDTTYRLYDYGRPRELHLEKGLAAVQENARSGKVQAGSPDGEKIELVASPYFVVEKYALSSEQSFALQREGASSAQILVAFSGCAQIECAGCGPVTLTAGDAVVVPACYGEFRVKPQWEVEFLRSRVPGTPRTAPVIWRGE
jgi:mannose-6-phosphate isomerase